MSSYTVAEARKRLSELIDRALNGESVVVTRQGKSLVEIKPIPRRITLADIKRLDAHRVGKAPDEDAGTLVSRMRDEDWS